MKLKTFARLGVLAGACGAGVNYGTDFLMRQLIAREQPKLPDFISAMISGGNEKDVYPEEVRQVQQKTLESHIKEIIELHTEKEGYKLIGRFYPAEKKSDLFLVLSHGFRCFGIREFAIISEYYHKLNYNLLIIDHRACGDSEGEYEGYGYFESQDTMLWLDYLNNRFGKDIKIFLHGVSMGAATVLMMSNKDLPENVKGIIADCSYTSAWDEFSYQLQTSFKMPVHPILDLVNMQAKKKAGYDFKDASPLECVRYSKVPILFCHGSADTFVPAFMVKKLYDACPNDKDIHITEGAIHARSFQSSPDPYIKKVTEFINKHK